jgi:hypothetical protein
MLLPFAIALPDDMVFAVPPDIWPPAIVLAAVFGQPVSALPLLPMLFALIALELMLLEDIALPLIAANAAPEDINPAARATAATRLRDRKYMGQSLICGEPADRAA